MATVEGEVGDVQGMVMRRLRERVSVWRRLFQQNWNLFKASRIGVIGLGIMFAFVILALSAPFMGLRDPFGWHAPEEDLIAPKVFWTYDSSVPGSEMVTAPEVTQPVAFRMEPDNFDARSDRIYVAAENRLYAMVTDPDFRTTPTRDRNAWGALNYLDVAAYGNPARTISVPPLAVDYGDYSQGVADYETYVGTDDGALFIFRDTGSVVPIPDIVRLDGAITGLGAFNGDLVAVPAGQNHLLVQGVADHLYWNGARWVSESLGGVGDTGQYASLAIGPGGRVYLASFNLVEGRPTVSVRSPTGVWSTMPPPEPYGASVIVGQYTSIAVGSDGYPRLAYYDATRGDLKYAVRNATAWQVSIVPSSIFGNVGMYASLALDGADNPRIAYYNYLSFKLEYAENTTGTWTIETPDPSGNATGTFASLALDPATEEPRIAYYDASARTLRYAERNAGVWTTTAVDAGPDVGQYASLALNATGAPRIAYYDAANAALKYASRTGTWTNETVDAAARPEVGDFGRYASLALNATGVPAIAYQDAANLTLRFAMWNGSGWAPGVLVNGTTVGGYASIEFDAADRPHIAYYAITTSRARDDIVVAGTATGKLYGIDVGIPGSIRLATPHEQQVDTWRYRVRWVVDLGSEVHIAGAPMRGNIPLFSPCFTADGSRVFVGTLDGRLHARRTSDGGPLWAGKESGLLVIDPVAPRLWRSAPVAYNASEGPERRTDVVFAGSPVGDRNADGRPESLVFALNATTGDPIREWAAWAPFAPYGGAAPVNRSIGVPDGGDLAQPAVASGTIFLGSSNGSFYGIRRDGAGSPGNASFIPPGSTTWRFSDRDLDAVAVAPRFTSAPFVLINKLVMLVVANTDNGTADPADDLGFLYAIKLTGALTWSQAFQAAIPGFPASWQAPASIDFAVWVGYGSPLLTGVQALWADGEFLAPSEPSWAHTYRCPAPGDPERRCPGYRSGNQYWLGLDSQGRDIFSQVIWGSRIALLVGFLAAIFSVVLGVVVGLVAGYVGGKIESVLMRFTDVILVLPGLPLIITLAAVLGASVWNIILVISLLGWPGIARIIRAEVLSLKERPFIDSARVTGASTTRIVFRHIAPNVMPLAFLYMTFSVSGAILTEAALSFIGLGDISTMSWGIMLQQVSQSKALEAWWWLLPPGMAITLISLAFFLVGRAFDEIVNPRLRKR